MLKFLSVFAVLISSQTFAASWVMVETDDAHRTRLTIVGNLAEEVVEQRYRWLMFDITEVMIDIDYSYPLANGERVHAIHFSVEADGTPCTPRTCRVPGRFDRLVSRTAWSPLVFDTSMVLARERVSQDGPEHVDVPTLARYFGASFGGDVAHALRDLRTPAFSCYGTLDGTRCTFGLSYGLVVNQLRGMSF